MSFRHRALYGATGQGKSTLAKALAAGLAKYKQQIILFNPLADEGWPEKSVQAYNADMLERALADPANYGAHVFVDEGQVLRQQFRQDKHHTIAVLGNVGRHLGYTLYLLGQYPTAVPPHMRWNCLECYCFNLGMEEHAVEVWKDFNRQSINGVPVWKVILTLRPFQFVHLTKFSAEIQEIPNPY
jgi:hypothetical protein